MVRKVQQKETKKVEKKTTEINDEKVYSRFLEEAKLTNDYMKHVATLDTGSILIMVAFLQNFKKPGAEIFVFLAALAFVTSLTGVVFSQRMIFSFVSNSTSDIKQTPLEKAKIVYRISSDIAVFSFLLAIGILLGFILFILFA